MQRTFKGITIQTLRGITNQDVVKSIVADHVQIIDSKIVSAHNAGMSSIKYELPCNFGLCNLDKSDAQILIYSELVTLYRKPIDAGGKGFSNTTIDIGVTTWLHIAWNNGMTDTERESRKNILKSCAWHCPR
jgi:hypothetical protein